MHTIVDNGCSKDMFMQKTIERKMLVLENALVFKEALAGSNVLTLRLLLVC